MRVLWSGGTAERALATAAKEVGSGYQLHVRSLGLTRSGGRDSVEVVVTAWNDNEIKEIPVHWEEQDP
jgi:hypothetical protein